MKLPRIERSGDGRYAAADQPRASVGGKGTSRLTAQPCAEEGT
ncbi:hypothetical protein ACFWMU_15860 [Streptomyces sp. NPDC058357]